MRSFQGDRVAIPPPKRHQVTPSRQDNSPPIETAEQGRHEVNHNRELRKVSAAACYYNPA